MEWYLWNEDLISPSATKEFLSSFWNFHLKAIFHIYISSPSYSIAYISLQVFIILSKELAIIPVLQE